MEETEADDDQPHNDPDIPSKPIDETPKRSTKKEAPQTTAAAQLQVEKWREAEPAWTGIIERCMRLAPVIHARYARIAEHDELVARVVKEAVELGAADAPSAGRTLSDVPYAEPTWAQTILGEDADPSAVRYFQDHLKDNILFLLALREARAVAMLAAILLEYALVLTGVRRPQMFELIVFAAAAEVETSPEPADLGRRKNLWVQRFKELRSITDREARRVRRRDDGPGEPDDDVLDLHAVLLNAARRLKLPHAQ